MLDTVWIRLTVSANSSIASEFGFADKMLEQFMFGPTGVTRFFTNKDGSTLLFNTNGRLVAQVEEHSDIIMDLLRQIRGTKGKTNGSKKQNKKTRSKRKTSKR